jgi:hypothetical protein
MSTYALTAVKSGKLRWTGNVNGIGRHGIFKEFAYGNLLKNNHFEGRGDERIIIRCILETSI